MKRVFEAADVRFPAEIKENGGFQKAMTIGLTGGIGCGKSSALDAFGKIGFSVVDADGIAAEIRSEPEFLRFARERFGGSAFAADGSVDRASLARIVFSDAAAREDLENFLHPRIRARWNARIRAAKPGEKIVVEVPLLFEKNYASDFDLTVCVAASEETQLERLEKRGLPRERARECDRFNASPEIPVFLISLKAGGVGLNITGADVVVHYDPWWNPAAEAQATDRAHRIGQTRAVTSVKLAVADSVEERVLFLQREKRRLLEELFEASAAENAKISLAEMRELLK